MTPSR